MFNTYFTVHGIGADFFKVADFRFCISELRRRLLYSTGVYWTPEKLWNKINIKTYVGSNKLAHFHITFLLFFFTRIIETLGPIKNSILSIWLFLLHSVREVLDSSDKINANAHLIKEHFSETTNDVSWCWCRQSNLHMFGIFSHFFTLRFLHAKKYKISSIFAGMLMRSFQMMLGNSMIFYIRQIPGGNNSLWQAWNTQHVILRQKRKKKERSCRCDGGKANRHGRLTGLVDGTTQLFRFFSYFEWKTIIRGTNSLSSLDRRWDYEALGSPRGVNGNRMWCDAGMVGEWQEQILWGQFKPRQLSY